MCPERLLNIATAPRAASKRWPCGTTNWPKVCAWVDSPRTGAKDGPGYFLGLLSAPRRLAENVTSRSVLTLDADKLTPTTCDALPVELRSLGCASVVYTTASSTPAAPRLRVLPLPDRDLLPDEYRRAIHYLVNLLGRDAFDAGSSQPERFMYMPTTPAEGEFFSEVIDGAPLGVDALLLDATLEDPGEPGEEPKATSPASPTTPLPEDVVRDAVTWSLGKLDELSALTEKGRIDWPGMPDGVGWDDGIWYAGQRLVQASNSSASYTIEDAKADFYAHAPESDSNYDRDHKWEKSVKDAGDQPLPYDSPQDDFDMVAGGSSLEAGERFKTGGAFILDAPTEVPAIWGDGDQVLWAEGEALTIVGPIGVGKTTITGQLVRSRIGLADSLLGYPVKATQGRVLYLAMDRPRQIARALRRMFAGVDRAVLDEHLVFWEGPPLQDLAKHPEELLRLCLQAHADTVSATEREKSLASVRRIVGAVPGGTGGVVNDERVVAVAEAIEELDNAICVYGSRLDQLEAARRDLLRPVANINIEGLTDDR